MCPQIRRFFRNAVSKTNIKLQLITSMSNQQLDCKKKVTKTAFNTALVLVQYVVSLGSGSYTA